MFVWYCIQFLLQLLAHMLIESSMVGYTQLIGCKVTTVRGVKFNAVQFSWTGPTGNTIVNSSRVAILPTYQKQNNFSSELLFDYLSEEDQGIYTCTVVILNAGTSASLNIVPFPSNLTITVFV